MKSTLNLDSLDRRLRQLEAQVTIFWADEMSMIAYTSNAVFFNRLLRKRDFKLSCINCIGKPGFQVFGVRDRRMAIITFAQVKGGSGKTTAAMCTVAELVARGTSVAALDLDPNRPLGEFFERVPAAAAR
jgi:Mrp family chromosome partitioning ATPase